MWYSVGRYGLPSKIYLTLHLQRRQPIVSIRGHYQPSTSCLYHSSTNADVRSCSSVSPFAALTGYDAAIKETGRLTDTKIELDDEELHNLNLKFQFLVEHLEDEPEVAVTYFKADERKAGGAYLEATGIVKKLDDFERLITMQDGTKIPMDDILTIESDAFSSLEQY